MFKRRDFLKNAVSSAAVGILAPSIFKQQSFAVAAASGAGLHFSSPSMEAQLSDSAPEFMQLNIDSLGKSRRGANVFDTTKVATGYTSTASSSAEVHRFEYRTVHQHGAGTPVWIIELVDRKITLISQWSGEEAAPEPLSFRFNLSSCHSTVLGLFDKNKALSIPALIHCPGQGSMRITANTTDDIGLSYQSEYKSTLATLEFPAATQNRKRIVYTLEVVAIYPELKGIHGDDRFDPFRRNWLNILQLSPSKGVLANNTASDSCALCYYEYADIASLTPDLAEGLTALDIVRQTLDYILAGGTTYGQPAPGDYPAKSAYPAPSSDTLPSLLIAAADCVRAGRSDAWLASNYAGVKNWADTMLATDKNGNGLIEYIVSGNSGSWPPGWPMTRPANWWDTIGCGHEDAYSNAQAYRALGDMEMLAKRVGKSEDAAVYRAAAVKLHQNYFKTFYDPATGVLAGWLSADGQLHDYYFLWVNGIAIHYGLVPKHAANAIMDKLMAKMKAVGYDKFNMGLPGNLIAVPLKDYADQSGQLIWGGGVRADNADAFQNYENGGATGCFAFWTLAALYDLGRKEEADRILFAMLGEYGRGGFEGRGPNGHSNDWRRWDGTPMGYEGFLTDNYYTMLAVPLRQNGISWKKGYRLETART